MYYYAYPFVIFAAIIVLIGLFDIGARVYYSKTGRSKGYFVEWMRKGAHASGGVIMAFVPQLGITQIDQFLILLALTFIFTLNEHRLFLMREMRPGALKYTWAFCAITVPIFYYQYFMIYTMAWLIYAIPDSLAALVGRGVGTPRDMLGGKSIAGFMAYALSAMAIFYFTGIPILMVIGLGLALAVVELIAKSGTDNLFCPALAALALYFLGVQ